VDFFYLATLMFVRSRFHVAARVANRGGARVFARINVGAEPPRKRCPLHAGAGIGFALDSATVRDSRLACLSTMPERVFRFTLDRRSRPVEESCGRARASPRTGTVSRRQSVVLGPQSLGRAAARARTRPGLDESLPVAVLGSNALRWGEGVRRAAMSALHVLGYGDVALAAVQFPARAPVANH